MIRCLSLFSGIGGLDLGLERSGMTIVGQSEIDPYACRVLAKHWPHVPNLGDITAITEADLERLGPIELVCGGFPCQDLSVAGKQGGIRASRSGLFWELMRIVRLVRPGYVLLENVPALLARADWMGAVLGELAESGYDAEWDCIPASAVGAPHRRDRIFIVAYCDGDGIVYEGRRRGLGGLRPLQGWGEEKHGPWGLSATLRAGGLGDFSNVPRMADGVPARVDRLRGLGNAVVPQVATYVAQRILEIEEE